jgi:hypothetical protein
VFIQRTNNQIIIKIPSNILKLKEVQEILDNLRYKEIAKNAKAKKSDLLALVSLAKKKRKI